MGCCITFHDKCWKKYKKRQDDELKNFSEMKKGFNTSLSEIKNTMEEIKDWDSLLNPKYKSEKVNINISQSSAYIPSKVKICNILYLIYGLFFCLINFIGVQIGLIIINSIFKEIVDELKFYLKSIPRKYNFYENIEIITYKAVPEIDIGMSFAFLGLITLKKCGFILSNIFQVLALGCFIILFLLFDFHTENELLNNYTKMEITVLIMFYILLCIFIGASSCIALKEFFNIYQKFYLKILCANNEIITDEEKEKEKYKNTYIEKILFFIFSVLSSFITIGLIRFIFSSVEYSEPKQILHLILIIYATIIVLSLIFYLYYTIPKIKKYCLTKNDTRVNNSAHNSKKQIETANNAVQDNEGHMKRNDSQANIFVGKIPTFNSQEVNQITLRTNITYNNLNKPIQNRIELDENKRIYNLPKICTCFGYVYFQKRDKDKKVCVCYQYSSFCSWFWEKLRKPMIFAPLVTQIFFHFCCVGENSILSERLLNVYSISTDLYYLIILLLIALIFIIISLYFSYKVSNCIRGRVYKQLIINICYIFSLLLGLSVSTATLSSMIISKEPFRKNDYDFWIQSDVIIFKSLELIMLSFYDFLDDDDCLNTSVFIYFERFIWTIIETLFDVYELHIKTLCIIQLTFSIIFFFLLCFFMLFFILDVRELNYEKFINK